MKIEVLFPEFCNLYGDISNIDYLKKCVPEAEVIYTAIDNEPAFLTQNVNLIYLGPLTERKQEIVIEKLMPYKEKIQELINNNTPFLFTGNAIEVLGKYIEDEDGTYRKEFYANYEQFNKIIESREYLCKGCYKKMDGSLCNDWKYCKRAYDIGRGDTIEDS